MEAEWRADVRVTPSKGFVFFPLLPPAEPQPSLLGEPVAAKMTGGRTLFQGCEIMPPALRGLEPMLHLSRSWPAVGQIIQRAPSGPAILS